jgi:hypothetical protein
MENAHMHAGSCDANLVHSCADVADWTMDWMCYLGCIPTRYARIDLIVDELTYLSQCVKH